MFAKTEHQAEVSYLTETRLLLKDGLLPLATSFKLVKTAVFMWVVISWDLAEEASPGLYFSGNNS